MSRREQAGSEPEGNSWGQNAAAIETEQTWDCAWLNVNQKPKMAQSALPRIERHDKILDWVPKQKRIRQAEMCRTEKGLF